MDMNFYECMIYDDPFNDDEEILSYTLTKDENQRKHDSVFIFVPIII